jgi:hypothetical protein
VKAILSDAFVVATAANTAYQVQRTSPVLFRSVAVFGVKSFAASGIPTANTGDVYLGNSKGQLPIKVESGKFVTIEPPAGQLYDLRDFWFAAANASDGLAFILTA